MSTTLSLPDLEHVIATEPCLLVWFDRAARPASYTFALTMQRFAEQLPSGVRVVRINDESDALARRYGLHGWPELLLFKDGKKVHHIVGIVDLSTLFLWALPFITTSITDVRRFHRQIFRDAPTAFPLYWQDDEVANRLAEEETARRRTSVRVGRDRQYQRAGTGR
ncbi:MAG: thioredoxin family protein [Acetobacteraceae bacterium]